MNSRLSIITNDYNNHIVVVVNGTTEFICEDYNHLVVLMNKFLRNTYGSKKS